jgi:hypothetical protein
MKNRIVFIDLLVGKILLEGEETGTLFTPKKKKKTKQTSHRDWRGGSAVKSTKLLFQQSWVHFPATTWWLTSICNGI